MSRRLELILSSALLVLCGLALSFEYAPASAIPFLILKSTSPDAQAKAASIGMIIVVSAVIVVFFVAFLGMRKK